MAFSKNAQTVLQRRYLSKDIEGNTIETIDDMFERVAACIADVDRKYDAKADVEGLKARFKDLMLAQKFMPNSPTLMNAGKPLGQLSACFVLPVGDSMEEIFDALKNAALIHKSGGGTGFSFSRIRPAGSSVRSTGGVASGPISFMKVFNAATEAVKQGGTRRGANMGILRVDHPDIMDFITCKKGNSDITNFNISVGVTEKFMQAARKNEEYDLINPVNGHIEGRLNAREVYDLIVDMAWSNGEPGIIFLDRLNKDNMTPALGDIESTNPCGEQPLLPYESCNLGSVNLANMIKKQDKGFIVDYDELGRVVDLAVHFLDNVIDANKYPLQEIEDMTKNTRKIGLGVMGFADLLFCLGIPYNSEEAIQIGEKIMGFIQARAHSASEKLAISRGAFPAFEGSILSKEKPLRNATSTTIAPTGTISIICGASSGIEPLFAISFVRNVMDDDELAEVHPYFEAVAKEQGFYSKELMRRIAEEGTLAHIEEIPQGIREVFVTSHDITPEYHIRMQAAFQKYTDNAVSKTVNFPNSATREDVKTVYDLAFDSGCKGVTIYRDGSRDVQVLYTGKKEEPSAEKGQIVPRPRPDITQGFTEKVRIGCGNLYVTVNYDEEGICEVFTNLGRAGGCPSQSEATSRLISTALRSGMDAYSLIEQLKGIRCHSTLRQKGLKVLSCPDAIGKVLEKVVKMQEEQNGGINMKKPAESSVQETVSCGENCSAFKGRTQEKPAGDCPECGGDVEHEGGCVVCRNCGYSKCG
ncbi:MAG: vitamin B12-dependent ribonucleotide reductase [Christensenellales bacterium]|jgi:ribonucleoside-diphosphate reductase alpha chain